jgi:hypothetical protein
VFSVSPKSKPEFVAPFPSCQVLEESEASTASGALLPDSAKKLANLLVSLAPATKKTVSRATQPAKNRILEARARIEAEKSRSQSRASEHPKKQ